MFCLGVLLRYRRRGDQLTLVCTTNGDKRIGDDPDFPHAECARIRDAEMRAVARELGADYFCLGEPDEGLYDTYANRVKLIEVIRHARPEVVFTHFTSDYNLDHTVTSELVFQATMLAQVASIKTASPALRRVPAIFYVDPGPGFGFEGTHFVAMEEATVAEARRLMGLHESQQGVARRLLGADYRDAMVARWRATGERVGVPYAEAFRPCLASRRTPLTNFLP
jgi:LmbE family N-acetylglucosaminyl deacetylase